MKKLWLFFSQAVTVFVAAWFVIATLQPQWLAAPAPPPAVSAPLVLPAPQVSAAAQPGSLAAAVRRAAPAVVSINTSRITRHPFADDPWFRLFFGQQGSQSQSGLGSGVIMSADGYVLTNNHVVQEADHIEAVLADGRRANARVIGADPESDLAVLKIDLPDLPVMTPSDSDRIEVGDRVLAIGNPFGVGQTVTSGIVSALGRDQLGINTFENFIQTDAAINPGNSGGALTDEQGRLLGINTAIYSRSGGSLGIGFAIPVNVARQALQDIVQNGRVVRGWIGVESTALTPELAENLGAASAQGVIITGVLNGGPAARAGMRPGDVVTRINGRPIRTVAELRSGITALRPGTAATFTALRQGQNVEMQLVPGLRPSVAQRQ
ncbi:S1C family serine protease [Ottowia cancrivicina]|uniref:Trypsin-like peptidase domain-containing protein n=1 Tax=Ottowia cancrivicina TaxID=3040346 RepID=A0AAW6RKR4_9BURK|nr:trypsin-like peptidase domain-containing protein [Ottowia sp. 10c7w1]MDG9699154.1 trypsin-like peptidase domain-containing protein [Ottowia sp. 10c7w1]